MPGFGSSRRNALALSLGWWYLRRMVRKRGAAAVAGFVAGEGLSFARKPRHRHRLRFLILLGAATGAGIFWWRRRRGGGDDWGDWEPAAPDGPIPPADHERLVSDSAATDAVAAGTGEAPSSPVPDPVAT